MQDSALWKRLLAHRFDAVDGSVPFSAKLAREERWSSTYTRRVLEEYRKFLYLSQISRGHVSPSIPVDRAWHMHLTYTRDYWEVMCKEVLNRPLHHEPSRGTEENKRFNQQFLETRLLYAQEFGRPPPEDIWPDVGGGPAGKGERAFGLILVGAVLVMAGFVLVDLSSTAFFGLLAVGALMIVAGFAVAAPMYQRKDSGACGGACGGADCGGSGCGGD